MPERRAKLEHVLAHTGSWLVPAIKAREIQPRETCVVFEIKGDTFAIVTYPGAAHPDLVLHIDR